jgi:anti-anti-sigma regulatory factor
MDIVEASLCGVPLLTIVGEGDSGLQLAQAAQRLMSPDDPRILLDLGLCPYLDSGCLTAILSLVQQVTPKGWVGVVNCPRMVQRLFGLVGLTSCSTFRVFQTLDEAGGAAAAA